MRLDFWYPSAGIGRIHGCRWVPEGQLRGVVHIVHGITEYAMRYDHVARYLADRGFLVVAQDHMGHGESVNGGGLDGYFHGGWDAAVADTWTLLKQLRTEYPNLPCILLGHSMGSFLARTIVCRYPDSGIAGLILSGTGWQPDALLPAAAFAMDRLCDILGQTTVSDRLLRTSYRVLNRRVEHPETIVDWVCRNRTVIRGHSMLVGRQPTVGLLRDMVHGVGEIQRRENLNRMSPQLPVLFVGGAEDPVGDYGAGVHRTAEVFRSYGLQDVEVRIYPLMRHEVLNEIHQEKVFADILNWIEKRI